MDSRSSAGRMPTRLSMRAWAIEPSMSYAASRRSKTTDAVKLFTRSVTGSSKRPDHTLAFGLPPSLDDMRPARIEEASGSGRSVRKNGQYKSKRLYERFTRLPQSRHIAAHPDSREPRCDRRGHRAGADARRRLERAPRKLCDRAAGADRDAACTRRIEPVPAPP